MGSKDIQGFSWELEDRVRIVPPTAEEFLPGVGVRLRVLSCVSTVFYAQLVFGPDEVCSSGLVSERRVSTGRFAGLGSRPDTQVDGTLAGQTGDWYKGQDQWAGWESGCLILGLRLPSGLSSRGFCPGGVSDDVEGDVSPRSGRVRSRL